MTDLPDDPIVASMLRTGYPPWIRDDWEDDEEDEDGLFFGAEEYEENEEE